MAGQIDGGDLRIGNLDRFGIFVFVQLGTDREAGFRRRRGDELDDRVRKLRSGLPRQLMVMKENSRCSILFHLLVPGGKWQTVIGSLISLASF